VADPFLTIAPSLAREAGVVGCAVLLELALFAALDRTWPMVKRERCSTARLSGALLVPQPAIMTALRLMISKGYVSPTADKKALKLSEDHFQLAQPLENIGVFSCSSGSANDPKSQQMVLGSQPPAIAGDSGLRSQVSVLTQVVSREELILPATSSSRGRPKTAREHEKRLFQIWRKSLSKRASTKLDRTRLRAIRRALAPEPDGYGFSYADVEQSLLGWSAFCAANDWRMEQMNRHDLALFLRDAAHIEQGIEQFHDRSSYSRDPEHDRTVRDAIAAHKTYQKENRVP